jgi:glutamyl-tRNA synthetase
MYSDITEYDKDTLAKKWKPEFKSFFENYISKLVEMSFNSADDLEAKTKSEIESAGLGLGNILPVYRIALTGTMKGPSIFDTMVLIGKDKSIERIAHISNLIA